MVATPGATPVTNPKELTLAEGEALNHVPPLLPLLVNTMDEPTHTVVGPPIVPALALEFTDTANEDDDAPQIPVTV